MGASPFLLLQLERSNSNVVVAAVGVLLPCLGLFVWGEGYGLSLLNQTTSRQGEVLASVIC